MVQKLLSLVFEMIQVVVFAVAIFLFVYLLLTQPHKINGASMEPNFFDSQYLLTDKVSYRIGKPERGDVIVFEAPPTQEEEFIKRIIALPGEQVSVQDGKVFVNKKELVESYLSSQVITRNAKFFSPDKVLTVPEDEYFVLGDNRDHSLDSRTFGFVTREMVTGKAWFIYWPLSVFGTISEPSYLI